MPNKKNQDIVNSLREKASKANSVIFADYIGLTAGQANDLRAKLREQNAEVVVAKNTLMKVALKEEKLHSAELDKDLKGNTAAIFSFSDAISPIKAIFDFAKKVELPKVKSAIIDGAYTNAQQVEIIKDLPSKEVLLSQVVGGLKSPLSGFVNVLGGVQKKFVYAVKAIADSKQ